MGEERLEHGQLEKAAVSTTAHPGRGYHSPSWNSGTRYMICRELSRPKTLLSPASQLPNINLRHSHVHKHAYISIHEHTPSATCLHTIHTLKRKNRKNIS